MHMVVTGVEFATEIFDGVVPLGVVPGEENRLLVEGVGVYSRGFL